MNEEQYAEVMGALRANDKEHESYNRRLHEHDEAIKELQQTQIQLANLTNAVNNLATGIGEIKTAVQGVDKRVADLEHEPADKWKKASWKVIELILAAAIGFLISYLSKGA
jgi:VIT1/CCC1 family predicted Fe2+/Mn2+ transporter